MAFADATCDHTRVRGAAARTPLAPAARLGLTAALGTVVAGGLWLSAWAATATAQLGNPLAGLGTPSTSTSTASISVSTTSTGTTSATKVVTIVVIVAAIVLIGAIAAYIVRDARRNAPVKAGAGGSFHEMTRAHEERRRRRRERAKAQRAARKRNR